MGDRLLAGLKRRLDGEATPRLAKRAKTPSESSGASSKQTEYVPGPSVPAYADGIYTWNYGRSAIDEAAAANAVGETPQACCWIMAAVGKLPPEPQVLCPFFGKKDHRGIDHSTMSSTVHVHTIAKRQDDDWRRKVSRVATRTRPKSTVEAGNDKSQSQSLTGDGPTAMLRPLLTLVELYAGIGSMSQAASCLGIAAELQAFTELPTPAADYLSTVHGAPNLGPTEHADYTGLNPVITTVTCECTPFTESGLQRFADDPRSAQILQSAEAILALRPRILIKENVRHFYSMDDNPHHGLFTAFKAALAPAMVTMPVQFVQDSQVGGTLYRTRGMLLAERADFAASLPQWGIAIASKMPVCPITLLAPLHTIPTSSYLLGTYEQTHLVKEATGSTSPMQVGRLWWGDSNTPLQAGVIVWWRGARYKVDDPTSSGKVRLIKEQPRGVRRHEQTYVMPSDILPHMHRGKWYPVFSPYAALKSPRGWGQLPEGNMCIIEESRLSAPRPRHLTVEEQFWQINAAAAVEHRSRLQATWQHLQFAAKSQRQLQGWVAGTVAAGTAMWAMATAHQRVQQQDSFLKAQWHSSVPQMHIDSPGMGGDTKRVVLVIFCLDPVI